MSATTATSLWTIAAYSLGAAGAVGVAAAVCICRDFANSTWGTEILFSSNDGSDSESITSSRDKLKDKKISDAPVSNSVFTFMEETLKQTKAVFVDLSKSAGVYNGGTSAATAA